MLLIQDLLIQQIEFVKLPFLSTKQIQYHFDIIDLVIISAVQPIDQIHSMKGEQISTDTFKRQCYIQFKSIRKAGRQQLFASRRIINSFTKKDQNQHEGIDEVDTTLTNQFDHIAQKAMSIHIDQISMAVISSAFQSELIQSQYFGLVCVKRLLLNSGTYMISPLINSFLHHLLHFSSIKTVLPLRKEAAWVLSNMTAGNNEQCKQMLKKKVHLTFLNLIIQSEQIAQNALIGLGNMAASGKQFKIQFLQQKIIQSLSYLFFKTIKIQLKQLIIWVITNIIKENPPFQSETVKFGLIFFCKSFREVFFQNSDESVYHILSTFCCYKNSESLKLYAKNELVPLLLKYGLNNLQQSQSKQTITFLMQLLARFSISSKFVFQMINNNVFELFQNLITINDSQKNIQAVLFIISNVSADKKDFADQVLAQSKLISEMIKILKGNSNNLRREVCYIFGNSALHASANVVSNILRQYQVVHLISQFICEATRKDDLTGGLINLRKIFKLGQIEQRKYEDEENYFLSDFLNSSCVPDRLTQLQLHQSEEVYKEVNAIWRLISNSCYWQNSSFI